MCSINSSDWVLLMRQSLSPKSTTGGSCVFKILPSQSLNVTNVSRVVLHKATMRKGQNSEKGPLKAGVCPRVSGAFPEREGSPMAEGMFQGTWQGGMSLNGKGSIRAWEPDPLIFQPFRLSYWEEFATISWPRHSHLAGNYSPINS